MDDDLNDGADNAMLELEERATLALQHALAAGTPEEDVRLLSYCSGIKYETLKPQRKD